MERNEITPDTTPATLTPEMLERYADAARALGFEPDEIDGFESACAFALRAGITPALVPDAVDSGHIRYDFERGSVRVLQDASTPSVLPNAQALSPESDSILARGLVLSALDSYGAEALALAERARSLVGIDGIEHIAHTLADSGDVETAWTIRGALSALVGESEPDEIGGAYESEARDGFDFVRFGGFAGVWGAR